MKYWRAKTPTIIQLEAVECGAVALGIILAHFGLWKPLEELRKECGVSKSGSKASDLLKVGRDYGLEAQGFRMTMEGLKEVDSPAILFWEYNHFLVLEGFSKKYVHINDPRTGPRKISYEDLERSFSGICLRFSKGPNFKKGGKPPQLFKMVYERIKSSNDAIRLIAYAGLALILPGLALPSFTRLFIDKIFVGKQLNWEFAFLFSVTIALGLAAALRGIQQLFLIRLKTKLSLRMTARFLWHLLKLPVEFYQARYAGEIAWRTTLNQNVATALTGQLANTAVDFLLVFFYGIAMFFYSPSIAIFGLLAGGANFLVLYFVTRVRMDAYARLQQDIGKSFSFSIGALRQMESIKASGNESNFFSQLVGYMTKTINAQQEIGQKDALLSSFPFFMNSLAVAVVLTIGTLEVMHGKISIGTLIALQTLLLAFLQPISQFVNLGQTLQNVKIDLNRINDALSNQPDPRYGLENKTADMGETKLKGYLEFQNVTFGYSRLDPPLIEDFSFKLTPGKSIALVGPTGCGKSTIAKLASSLYFPWKGTILYDGKPFEEMNKEVFHNSISKVDQNIFLFEGTIEDNLTLWNPLIQEKNLHKASVDAGIHDEVLEKPGDYHFVLTEDGKNMSGGQRQRLEIARALIINPSLLILDEATSAIDSVKEKLIMENLRKRGCSMVIIAHRLSTIQSCDEIIVLEKGKIKGRGTHEELKKSLPLYQELVKKESFQ